MQEHSIFTTVNYFSRNYCDIWDLWKIRGSES